MNPRESQDDFCEARVTEAIEQQAADWLALREARELTPTEAEAYAVWRSADVRHAAAVDELEATWRTLDQLQAYPRPSNGADDPDVLTRRNGWRTHASLWLAAAATVVVSGTLWLRPHLPPTAPVVVAPQVELAPTLRLPDGTEVEFRPGSEVVPQFTENERRVRLVRGEAYFSVAKNPARPFVVEANGIAVRAVGTAFNVRLAAAVVEVLVTEGTVRVGTPPVVATAEAASTLIAGQRTLVTMDSTAEAAAPRVETLAPAEIDRALAWQTSRLVFDATPLAAVVDQFNRHADRKIVLRDARLAALPISGRFRAGNLDSFLELLERGFGVEIERRNGEILLRHAGR